MEATVKVISSISDNFEPDIISVTVWIEGEADSKAEAARAYNKSLSSLLSALEKTGVKSEDVKNGSLDIRPIWRKQKKTGRYSYGSDLSFEVPCVEERFDAVWAALIGLGDSVTFDFDYGLKDYEGAREKIIRRTVDAGRKRAAVLADATGCDLGPIVHVENDLRGIACCDSGYAVAESMTASGSAKDESPVFNPRPVNVSCEVTLEYALVARQG